METNIIYNEDCLKGMKRLPDNSVDFVLTDPPYNVEKAEWDIGVLDLIDESARETARVLKNEGVMYWFVPTRHLLKFGQLISQYIPYRWVFIWNTPNNMLVGDLGFSKYTAVLVFSRAKSIHKNMQDLKSINWKPNNNGHPTPKPIEIISYLIKKNTLPGATVFDPFMGSGTTAVACKQLNRQYIGFEISKEYCEIARKRLEQENLSNIFKDLTLKQ